MTSFALLSWTSGGIPEVCFYMLKYGGNPDEMAMSDGVRKTGFFVLCCVVDGQELLQA